MTHRPSQFHVDLEFKNIKRVMELDERKLDLNNLTEDEVSRLAVRDLNMKIFETAADRQINKMTL